jgi:hypothetical protein
MIGSKGDLKQGILGALTAGETTTRQSTSHATSYAMGYKFIKTCFHWMHKSCC